MRIVVPVQNGRTWSSIRRMMVALFMPTIGVHLGRACFANVKQPFTRALCGAGLFYGEGVFLCFCFYGKFSNNCGWIYFNCFILIIQFIQPCTLSPVSTTVTIKSRAGRSVESSTTMIPNNSNRTAIQSMMRNTRMMRMTRRRRMGMERMWMER